MNIMEFDEFSYENDISKQLFKNVLKQWRKKDDYITDYIKIPEDKYISFNFVKELISSYNRINPEVVFVPIYNIPLI